MMPPVYCVFYLIALFARDEPGMSYTDSLNLVIIVNGVGLPARVLPGYIADRYIGVLNVQAAAGVVFDSQPEAEWQETEAKARAVLRAAEIVEAGLDHGD